MENDDEQVGTVLTRREAMAAAGRFAAVLGFAGAAGNAQAQSSKIHLVASPQLTEGPFFVDEKLNRSDLVSGTSRTSVKNGILLHLSFTVHRLDDTAHALMQGAYVDVWHADAAGVYSDENNPMNHEDTSHQTWLRGYQVSNASGLVTFKTIFPGWYRGRTPHIHFKIRAYSASKKVTAEFTSQVFFKDVDATRIYQKEPYLSAGERDTNHHNDNVFTERLSDGSIAGDHMLLDLKKLPGTEGYSAHFHVGLTKANLSSGGRRAGGPPGGGFGGPPPGGFGGPPPGGPGGGPPPPPGGFPF